MSRQNALDYEELAPGSRVYGYEFVNGEPTAVVSELNFSRIPHGRHPTHGGTFVLLPPGPVVGSPRNGYKIYRLGTDGQTLQEELPPTNSSSSSSSSSSAPQLGPPIRLTATGTLAESMQGASFGNVASSILFGRPLVTREMRGLLDVIQSLEFALGEQQHTSGVRGHGHGGNFAETMAAGATISRLQRELTQADAAYQQLLDRESHRYHAGGGRIGIVSALFGSNSRSFLEASIRGIQRQLNALQPDVEEQARGLGTMATGLHGLHDREITRLTARRAQVEAELRACPAEGGAGCVISRKSRQRKSRQRKSRRRMSRKNRRR